MLPSLQRDPRPHTSVHAAARLTAAWPVPRRLLPWCVAVLLGGACVVAAAQPQPDSPPGDQSPPVAPDAPAGSIEVTGGADADADDADAVDVPLSPAVTRLLESPVLDDAAKQQRAVFHGRWDDLDEASLPPALHAQFRAMRGLASPDLAEGNRDAAYWSASALFQQGDLDAARAALSHNGGGKVPALAFTLLHAQIDEALGRFPDAASRLVRVRERFQHERSDDPAELTAAAEAIALLARLQGRPSGDYQLAMALLDRAVQRDPLYWPAQLVQAELLYEKDNRPEAGAALQAAMTLNPRAARGWALAASMAIDGYDFARSRKLLAQLHTTLPDHPAWVRLQVKALLRNGEVREAAPLLQAALAESPDAPDLLAWDAALQARRLDPDALTRALQRFDRVAPGHPLAYATAGQVMADARQYRDSERLFREAIRRQPNDAAPRLAMGLMLMQLGDLPAARRALADAARLDPFHARVNNSLELVTEMLAWPTVQSPHFLIRYRPGPDAVLARDLPPVMERIRADLSAVFGEATARPTQIDLMPDADSFAVRITGEPELAALAACTGDVLAMTPPRLGATQTGVYHWANVLRHEFTHAVIFHHSHALAPRWFHEGTATRFEELNRSFEHQLMLAGAYNAGKLIHLDDLNEAFASPMIGFAYQQSDWIIEYIMDTWGPQSLETMMQVYGRGGLDADAIAAVTGGDTDAFMEGFKAWAGQQVRAWGLDQRPIPEGLPPLVLRDQPMPSDETVALWRAAAPNHPQLLRILAVRALDAFDASNADAETVRAALLRYALARPDDPWPQRQLARLALDAGDTDTAIGVLEWLDHSTLEDPQWAGALVGLYRQRGDYAMAYDAALRTLYREPYNADFRELAAAVAIQLGDLHAAALHIEALTILEPDETLHQRRLDAVRKRLDAQPTD